MFSVYSHVRLVAAFASTTIKLYEAPVKQGEDLSRGGSSRTAMGIITPRNVDACAQYLLGKSFRISAESGLTFLRQEKEVIEEASSCGLVSFADHLLAVGRD